VLRFHAGGDMMSIITLEGVTLDEVIAGAREADRKHE
jgi:hypothetical protein